ncbi:hypothetical protein SALBM311S_03562 [Streptomyces alboniger]
MAPTSPHVQAKFSQPAREMPKAPAMTLPVRTPLYPKVTMAPRATTRRPARTEGRLLRRARRQQPQARSTSPIVYAVTYRVRYAAYVLSCA